MENDLVYTRGGGKLVTIMIPSRGRIEKLFKVLENIKDVTNNLKDIEVVIRFDDDDSSSICKIPDLHKFPFDVFVIVGKRGGGYKDLHHYINEMCSLSRGDFLFLFNDDSFIKTKNWDDILKEHLSKTIILNPNTNDESNIYNTFPIISRDIFETLGHWSMQTHNDTWMQEIGRVLHIELYLKNFEIFHDRPSEHIEETEDITWNQRKKIFPISRTEFDDPKFVMLRKLDIMKIMNLLNNKK